jgi:hypothetical protein
MQIDITGAVYYMISKVSLILCNVNQQNAHFLDLIKTLNFKMGVFLV